jgi:hypothetical protein
MLSPSQSEHRPFAALRGLMRKRSATERCELCGVDLSTEHPHLIEAATHRLVCSCDPCAVLFSDAQGVRFLRVPRQVRWLSSFRVTDAQWDALRLPINLAFFCRSSVTTEVAAYYPSPAGATESLLPLDAWCELTQENPVLAELAPDVEALLVNRTGPARDYFRAPIDRCFELVGLLRTRWRGLSGGGEIWAEIERFFTRLKQQSCRS